MTIGPGSRLGQYEIVAPLGAGGMGEVFRARDTKLGREVALKLVLEVFLGDHDRLARFEREARTLASLNHPGIATLHGLEQATPAGSAAPVHFLVMELVEGETLAERIARRLTLDEAVNIARQIAEALEAAHEKGIIHRDLKPANVKITPEDKVKVLDFGLAKAMGEAAGGSGKESVLNSPTMSAMATAQGVILGTAAYMAPEQARGAQADHRSDIFSFGIVLYEMLTGRHPFPGETVSDVLAAVLVREPDLSALPQDLSPRLTDLVRRCLEKQPRRRWQAIGDVRHELEVIAAQPRAVATPAPQASAASAPRPMWQRAMPAALAALIASAITAGVLWTMRPAITPAVITRFPLALSDNQTFNLGRPAIAVSPDGRRIAYIANSQVYVRSLSEHDASPVKATSQGGALLGSIVFSPDGRSIAYWQAGQIKTVEIAGGAPVTVCATESPGGISWSGDSLLFGATKGVMRVPASGGQPEVIVPLENQEIAFRPQMLPDANAVLFTLAPAGSGEQWEKAKTVVQSLETGTRTILVEGASDARYVPSGLGSPKRGERGGGHLVYAVSGVVFARAFDVSRLAVTGAVSVVEGVRRGSGNVGGGTAQFSVSDTGTLAYIPGPAAGTGATNLKIGLFDRSGVAELLNVPQGPYSEPRMSPDGRAIVFGRDDGRDVSIWFYELSGGGSARRLTFGGRDRYPVWTADSQRVVFQSDREGDLALFWQAADGTGTAERLTRPEKSVAHVAQSSSPDGAVLLVDRVETGKTTLLVLSLKGRTLAPFGGVESILSTGAIFSPDGRWVAYSARPPNTGGSSLFVQPFPATGAKSQVSGSAESGHHQMWSSDGKELFYNPGPGPPLTGVSVSTTRGFAFGAAPGVTKAFTVLSPTQQRPYDAARDGKRFLGLISADQPSALTGSDIQIVLNWFEELRARAPVK
ncbi:MAG: protein kinase [Acidobacteriota bacterium]|nr:protein kinase [Acidobacteriota bacterium]